MPENYLRGFTEGVNVANKFRQAFIPDWILPGASFLPGPPYWWPEADLKLVPATWSEPSASPSFYSYNDTPLNQNYPSASHYPCPYQSHDCPPHSYQRMCPMDPRNTLPYVNPIESSQEGQLENFARPQFQSPLLQASNDSSSYDTSRIPNAKPTSPSPKSPISLSQPSTSMKRVKKANDITYASIIAQAIHSTPDKRLTVHGIYRWIEENYADTYDPRDKSWKNTVRHNLSRNICFKLIARRDHANGSRGRGGYWTTDPRCMSKLHNGVLAGGAIHKKRMKGGHSRKVQCGDRKTKECLERSFPPSVVFLSSSPSSSPAVTPDIACDESGFVALPPTECPSKSFLRIENILN